MADSGPWIRAAFEVPEAFSDLVSSVLFDLGSSGQELQEGSGPGTIGVVAFFGPGEHQGLVESNLRSALAELGPAGDEILTIEDLAILVEPVPTADWSLGWRDHFRPIHIAGRVCVCPPWETLPDPPGGSPL